MTVRTLFGRCRSKISRLSCLLRSTRCEFDSRLSPGQCVGIVKLQYTTTVRAINV